jgi:leucyl aminopeptidase
MGFTLSETNACAIDTDLLSLIVGGDDWAKDIGDLLGNDFGAEVITIAEEEGFEGKAGQAFLTHSLGKIPARRVLLLGRGDKDLSNDQIKDLGASVSKKGGGVRAQSAAVWGRWTDDFMGGSASAAIALVAEGLAIGTYRFDKHKAEREELPVLADFTILGPGTAGSQAAVARAEHIAAGVILARDLVNEPPQICTPEYLADQATSIADAHGFEIHVFDRAALEEKGMNLHASVGRGSIEPPVLIHLTYRGKNPTKTIAYVGKGVTFDTGGYSLKPAASMLNMHCDMAGGAAVLGAAEAIGRLQPEGVEIHFLVPSASNRISSNAYTVNEIIKGYGGKTVQIINTDAEGRLLLADALAYAVELGAEEIVDLATLTGACVVALGEHYTGVFSNDDDMASALLDAAAEAGERFWRLPLDPRLRDKLKSDVADMKNCGDRWGGAITAALFLKEWVGDTTWCHLDIAGPAFLEAEGSLGPKGGTGHAVATLVTYATR